MSRWNINIEEEIRQKCSGLRLGLWSGRVQVNEGTEALQTEIAEQLDAIANRMEVSAINSLSTNAATRAAYKACGKDPSRYRPSAEALLRRVVKGKGLYRVNNVVDTLNLLSAETGYSIGGFDRDRIEGDMQLGIGRENEPYSAIGRGDLNISGLPVLRDDKGAFGTPTSDSERTMVTENMEYFLMVIYDFGQDDRLVTALDRATELLTRYAEATHVNTEILEA